MCDLNWCPMCDCAISYESDSLYCSLICLLKDTDCYYNAILNKDPQMFIPMPDIYNSTHINDMNDSSNMLLSSSPLSLSKSVDTSASFTPAYINLDQSIEKLNKATI
ncbi:uncharacterized protein BX663DRAFT_494396 [Cokeromyces recurvatus]|uniref:uncharacterized protein n=1 Tax=Cokeromyces recurvatus TaxID=90255 RepID=UPI00221F76FB|nr:uncharacterized protein BX663DRAFT_494396 [Cokeromyces recurvatus]KAI7906977.1 hypothetical protein BX663DRAFT_494396 [Cokeromyces recurvatus]